MGSPVLLHLLTMAFIDAFGYSWQAHTRDDLDQAVEHITDTRTINGFDDALRSPLAFLPPGERKPPTHRSLKPGQGRSSKLGEPNTEAIAELLEKRLAHDLAS